jgi:HSP20 family protein
MDISEDEKHVYIEAEIPGVEKKDLKISVQDNVLTISGEKKKEEEKKGKNYYRSERVYGSFTRSMTLPEDVNVEKVDAKFEEGILKITLEKLEQKPVKEKLIDIK